MTSGNTVLSLLLVLLLLGAATFVLGVSHAGLDGDGDGVTDAEDCAPVDSTLWSAPGEVSGVRFLAGAPTTLEWDAPSDLGGDRSAVTYDVLRSSRPDEFVERLGCVELGGADRTAVDLRTPPSGHVTHYLVRGLSCDTGDPGASSTGAPRIIGDFTAVENLNAAGPGSLAQTVADASSGDLICVPLAGTILLAGSPILIDKSLTVRGSGEGVLTVDADGLSAVFEVSDTISTTTEVTLSDMTVTRAAVARPAVDVLADQFAIETSTIIDNPDRGLDLDGQPIVVSIDHCTVVSNDSAVVLGSNNVLTMTDSDVSSNGGGIQTSLGSSTTILSSRLHDNGFGFTYVTGGVASNATILVDSTEISGNAGDGIYIEGSVASAVITKTLIAGNGTGVTSSTYATVTVRDSTIAGNQTGAYAYLGGTFVLDSTTVAYNTGVGVSTYYLSTVAPRNSLLFGNGLNCCEKDQDGECTAGGGCCFGIDSAGHNLSDDASCPFAEPGDQQSTPAMMAPIANNGGPFPIYLPLPNSPVLDAGFCDPGTDQRGRPRPVNLDDVPDVTENACDIGAVERQADDW